MVVYLDTSAAVKLVVAEPETEALTRWLTGREIVANDLCERSFSAPHDARHPTG